MPMSIQRLSKLQNGNLFTNKTLWLLLVNNHQIKMPNKCFNFTFNYCQTSNLILINIKDENLTNECESFNFRYFFFKEIEKWLI